MSTCRRLYLSPCVITNFKLIRHTRPKTVKKLLGEILMETFHNIGLDMGFEGIKHWKKMLKSNKQMRSEFTGRW